MNSLKRNIFAAAMILFAVCSWAQGPNNSGTYYSNADGKKGSALKTALAGIINQHTKLSYKSLWEHFKTTDKRADGKVWDMYSCTTNYDFDKDRAGNYQKEGDVFNREHSFPKDWFNDSSPMNTDLMHIVPTDGKVNGMRSNYPFGETDGEKYKSNNGFSKLGKNTTSGYSGIVFESNDEYKGDFARIYFYMVTCYENKVSGWKSDMLSGDKYPAFRDWAKQLLLKWAQEDPVSQKEIDRNNAVYKIQKNRNPYVDYPGLEQYVWGDKKDIVFSYNNYEKPTIIELPTEEQPAFVDVYTISGTKVRTKVCRQTATDGLQHGIYVVEGKKIVK